MGYVGADVTVCYRHCYRRHRTFYDVTADTGASVGPILADDAIHHCHSSAAVVEDAAPPYPRKIGLGQRCCR